MPIPAGCDDNALGPDHTPCFRRRRDRERLALLVIGGCRGEFRRGLSVRHVSRQCYRLTVDRLVCQRAKSSPKGQHLVTAVLERGCLWRVDHLFVVQFANLEPATIGTMGVRTFEYRSFDGALFRLRWSGVVAGW